MTQGDRSEIAHATNHSGARVPPDVAAIADVLEEHLYDRGNDVRTWPDDEAAAYRELGWSEGTAAARRVMFEKAARALLAAIMGVPVVTGQGEQVSS